MMRLVMHNPQAERAACDRAAMLAKIHIARKQLGLTEEAYRDVLRRVTGKESAAGLGPSQLEAVLQDFCRLGWKGKAKRRPLSARAQVRMIHGIWAEMQPLLSDGSEAALRAFVRRQTKSALQPDGVAAPEFLDAAQANKVLEGLKAWRARLQRAAAQSTPPEAA